MTERLIFPQQDLAEDKPLCESWHAREPAHDVEHNCKTFEEVSQRVRRLAGRPLHGNLMDEDGTITTRTKCLTLRIKSAHLLRRFSPPPCSWLIGRLLETRPATDLHTNDLKKTSVCLCVIEKKESKLIDQQIS